MKDLQNQLIVYRLTQELTADLMDFTKDDVSLTLAAHTPLYVGRAIPFYALYFYATVLNTVSDVTLIAEFWGNNNQWNSFDSLTYLDDTKCFRRNGFIKWKTNEENTTPYWTTTEINGREAYWIRFTVSPTATSAMTVRAMNILFSDDSDLIKEYFPLSTNSDFKQGASDYILHHVSARDTIIQKFRNRGLRRVSPEHNKYERVTGWDLLDVQEVNLAATHFALAKIFYGVSDQPDDNWSMKARKHEKIALENLKLAFLSFDSSGDGDQRINRNVTVGWAKR